MRPSILRSISAAVFLFVSCGSSLAQVSQSSATLTSQQKSDQAWFVLQREQPSGPISIDPLLKVVNGQMAAVPDACVSNPKFDKFEKDYLRPGQTYSASFGSAAAGTVRIRNNGSGPEGTIVDYEGAAPIRGLIMGLATNAPIQGRANSSRGLPTQEERKLAIAFAASRFVERGFSSEMTKRMKTETLTRASLRPSKAAALIGSFALSGQGEAGEKHNLFFVASQQEGQLVPELVLLHISHGENDNQTISLVDYGDLLGDGQDEVVTLLTFYEDYQYQVYRHAKEDHRWERVFETEVLGCE